MKAGNRHIAGSMRAHFPHSTIVSLGNSKYRPPAADIANRGHVAVVQNAATQGEAVPAAARADLPATQLDRCSSPNYHQRDLDALTSPPSARCSVS